MVCFYFLQLIHEQLQVTSVFTNLMSGTISNITQTNKQDSGVGSWESH